MEDCGEARKDVRALPLLYQDIIDIGIGDFDSSGFPGPAEASFKVNSAEFQRHLLAIAGADGNSAPVTIDNLLRGQTSGLPIMLTFDDGGSSAYTCTAGLLESVGWRGHFFVTVDRIGTRGFLTANQIRELRVRGHVIGSHSYSHPMRMLCIRYANICDEWSRSVDVLSDILEEPVMIASLPGGCYSRQVAKASARAGIRILFTSEPVIRGAYIDDCLLLGRFHIRSDSPAWFVGDLAAGMLGPRLKQWAFWNTKKVAKLVGGRMYLKARDKLLANHPNCSR